MTSENGGPRKQLESLITTILDNGTTCRLDGSLVREIGPFVESSTTAAKPAEQVLVEAYSSERNLLLDFGCGAAHHRRFVEEIGYRWRGVDYLEGVAPLARDQVAALSDEITFYDGRILPYGDGEFDVVYAMFVLHCVQHTDLSFREIARVLKPGGQFIGQVSAMEQQVDYSTFNITPYGLKVACRSGGLRLVKLYPKHDVFSFMFWRLMVAMGASDDNEVRGMLDPDGFFHREVIRIGEQRGLSIRDVNLLRLKFCSQYVFHVEKPVD